MKTTDLLEQRATILDRMNAANTADDNTAFDAANEELRAVDAKIDRAKKIETAERSEPGRVLTGSTDEHLSNELRTRFSLVRALAMQAGISGHDYGFEREVQPELVKRSGRNPEGVLVPTDIFLEKRTVTTAAPAAGPGGNLIATELHGELYFDRLRAALKVQSMGATVLQGLVGNIDIPGLKTSVTTGWVAENTALSSSDPEFRKVTLTPKHAGGIAELSRNMLQQTSRDVENLVRNDFAQVLAAALDQAAINGSGTGAEPRGVLNTAGIGVHSMGTNGAALGIDTAADIMGKLIDADAPAVSRGFLTNGKVHVAAMKLKDGQARPYGIGEVFKGERVEFSNNVPSNLTKGTGTNLSALIYGNWSDLLIGYWSAFDVLVNPYEAVAYSKGNVSIRAMLTADIAVRYAESFAAAKDVVA